MMMNRIQKIRYLFFFCLLFWVIPKATFALPALRTLAEARGIEIRTAVNEGPLVDDPLYPQALGPQFNSVTPELSLLFKNVQPSRGNYVFTFADEVVDFAKANGINVHAHSLVWHWADPLWLILGNETRDEVIEILREHITTVVGRYRGRIRSGIHNRPGYGGRTQPGRARYSGRC